MYCKKRFCLAFALILSGAILLTGCAEKDGGQQSDTSVSLWSFEQTDPDTEMFETGYPAFFSEEDNEQDYSNIICYSEQEVYPADTERIDITVENQNVGKGFYVYDLPYIEKNTDGEWVRLEFDEEFYNNFMAMANDKWPYCYIENSETTPFSTRVCILPAEELAEPLTEGDYRAVVFVGKETIYAPFKIEN